MMQPSARAPFHVPDDAALQDPQTLLNHLLDASAYARGSFDGAGFARLLEAAASVIQQQMAECRVQRGLAIASQTLATELAMKCEQLQQSQGAYVHDQYTSPRPMAPAPMQQPSMFGASRAPAPAAMPAAALSHQSPTLTPHIAGEVPHSDAGLPPLPGGVGEPRGAAWMGQSDQFRNGHPPPAAGSQTYGSCGSAQQARAPQPPPTDAAADAETERAVDGMVHNLKQRFKQSGVTLPLEKHAGTVYRLGSRKLQLSIRNSRLMVRVGSSYTDFLEYLSKAAL